MFLKQYYIVHITNDVFFKKLLSMFSFTQVHYLDTTPLIRPAQKRIEKVLAKYDFDGNVSIRYLQQLSQKEKRLMRKCKNTSFLTFELQDPDDLPFRKGEIMTIVSKDEEQWWTARNSLGQTGSIPVPYVVKVNTYTYNIYI